MNTRIWHFDFAAPDVDDVCRVRRCKTERERDRECGDGISSVHIQIATAAPLSLSFAP